MRDSTPRICAAVEESQFHVVVEGYIDRTCIGGVLTKVEVPKYVGVLTYGSAVPMITRAIEFSREAIQGRRPGRRQRAPRRPYPR